MLAEALHSVADILNQLLLRIGVLQAMRAPTQQHPYGYMRDRFVWALISAVGSVVSVDAECFSGWLVSWLSVGAHQRGGLWLEHFHVVREYMSVG